MGRTKGSVNKSKIDNTETLNAVIKQREIDAVLKSVPVTEVWQVIPPSGIGYVFYAVSGRVTNSPHKVEINKALTDLVMHYLRHKYRVSFVRKE